MKARLKTFLLSSLGTVSLFTALFAASCEEDKCKAIVCASGGVCNEGDCLCASGFEGNQCETETREKFKGIWYITEDGTLSTTAQYTVAVEQGTNITELQITNFQNSFTQPVNAYVKSDTIYIPQQTINNRTVQGIGYIGDDPFYGVHGILTLRYSVRDANNVVDDFGLSAGNPSLWNK